MTPATPPRSRNRRAKSSTLEPPKLQQVSPVTPHRQRQFTAPVTPGTVSMKQQQAQTNRSSSPLQRSPLKGLKTPEYTPAKSCTKRRLDLLSEPKELESVSRVLFQETGNEDNAKSNVRLTTTDTDRYSSQMTSGGHKLFDDTPKLLPPTSKNDAFASFLQSQKVEEDTAFQNARKIPKQVPGTPSDRVVTFQLAKDWNNNSGHCFSSDEEERGEELISKATLKNPFTSDEIVDDRTRRLRQKQLISENPNLKDTVTYLNKSGQVAKEIHLSKEEQERFKPKALFTEELKRKDLQK